jgi:hypothetical protein
VDRFRKRKAEEELADMASYEIKKGRRLFEPIIAGIHRERAEYALESEAELDASSPAIGSLSDLTASLASSLSAASSSSASLTAVQFLDPTKNPSSLDQRIESGLANFPSWMKSDVARHDMTRRPRKNLPQAHLSRLTKKRDKTYYEDDSSADGDIDDDDDEGGCAGKKKSKKTKPKTKGRRSLCNVSFSNYDLGHLVNGWPDDPIEDRPFDFHFSKKSIIRSHIAVGFMPMTGRAAKDPKVRFEFGPDGAPPADAARMDLLRAEYKEAGEAVTKLGYHGDMLDVVPREAEAAEIPSDEEAQIEHIVRNKLINKPGGLFRTGLIVANCRVVMESSKQVVREAGELIEVAAAKKVANNKTMEDEGVLAYQAWVESGRPKTDEGWPKMHLKPAKSIIKVLLPMIDIKGELKMKNFDRVGVCLKWLGEIARGMTWDQHMREYMMIVWEERATEGHTFDLTAPPLFEVGGV